MFLMFQFSFMGCKNPSVTLINQPLKTLFTHCVTGGKPKFHFLFYVVSETLTCLTIHNSTFGFVTLFSFHFYKYFRIWAAEKLNNRPVKTLPHPSFVYSAKFHPRVSKVVVTAGYDRIIRIWTVAGDDAHGQVNTVTAPLVHDMT